MDCVYKCFINRFWLMIQVLISVELMLIAVYKFFNNTDLFFVRG